MSAKLSIWGLAASLTAMSAAMAPAQEWNPSYSLFGAPGLMDMPTATSLPNGTIGLTVSRVGNHTRMNAAFQATPRLTALFRYGMISDFTGPGTQSDTSRSLDLHYRFLDEGRWAPAMAVGVRDLSGTGPYAGEYVVASKTIGDNLHLTAGMGWGSLAGRGGFANPLGLGPRPAAAGQGGTLGSKQFFHGDAAFFGGVEYALNNSWRLKAEYSSDSYARDQGNGVFAPKSPFNFGVAYRPDNWIELGAYAVQGREFGLTATVILDPNTSYATRGADPAPVPVRADLAAPEAGWSVDPGHDARLAGVLSAAMKNEGLVLVGLQTQGRTMRVRYENTRYRAESQGMGRMARILSQVATPEIDRFQLEPVSDGLAKSQLVLRRADLVALENELGAAASMWDRAEIGDAGPAAGLTAPTAAPERFSWGIAPYLDTATQGTGATEHFQYQLGLAASATYKIRPNLWIDAEIRQRAFGNEQPGPALAPVGRYPVVRRDAGDYMLSKSPQLQHLTLTHLAKAAPDVYTKLTFGYLERMYGGLSAELLWKPASSRLGLGAELTYGVKRATQGLGFQNQDSLSGFVSAYYEFDGDIVGRIDAGRYLAGDWGSTLSLAREFPNGWRVGGYVTLTDMPNATYGKGSFEKGLEVTIPMNWLLGSPTRNTRDFDIKSAQRDGGARIDVGGDLYSRIRDSHAKDLQDSWGRFWK